MKLIGFVLSCSAMGIGLGLAIAQQLDDETPPDASPPAPAPDPVTEGVADSGTSPPSGGTMYGIVAPKKGRRAAARRTITPDAAQINMQTHAAAAREKRMTTYRGTQLVINDGLGKFQAQKQVIAAFAQLDPKSPERLQHFAWVDKMPELNPVGWAGHITKMEPSPGGVLVEIKVTPIFAPSGGQVASAEFCIERWLYQAGVLQQIPNPHRHRPGGGALMRD